MKLRLILLLTVLFHLQTYAQIGFQEHLVLGGIYSPKGTASPHAADIDGDGDMDILCAATEDNKIVWFENTDGLGTFGFQKTVSADAQGVGSVFPADIDGDGDLDVLASLTGDPKIIWFENTDGQGTFGIQQTITTSIFSGFSTVYAKDLDGDGDIDVYASSSRAIPINTGKTTWYENLDGLGTFGIERQISNLTLPRSAHADDIDGDGDIDLISSDFTSGGRIAWYQNLDGEGTFGLQQIISIFNSPNKVITSDIDGDGDVDILFNSRWDSQLYWIENLDGLGTFSADEQLIGDQNGLKSALYPSDVDNDGDIDVISAGEQLVWFENMDGQGTYGTQQLIKDGDFHECLAIDIDGDGDSDVISSNITDDKVNWFENTDGLGSYGSEQIITSSFGPSSTTTTDFDGDGDIDIVYSFYNQNNLTWNENLDGEGTFDITKTLVTNVIQASEVIAADIDGDGDKDLMFSTYGTTNFEERIGWYENTDGQGTFGPEQLIELDERAGSIHVSDLDGDGDLDLLANFEKIYWYENTDGLGSFGSKQSISSTEFIIGLIVSADLDGDNDMDVLINSRDDNKISWYENMDGQGNFGTEQILTTDAALANGVFAADIDADGDLDVLYSAGEKVAWLENTNGQGTFDQETIIIEQYGCHVTAGDMDDDGDLDVLYSSLSELVWQENTDGQGTFGLPNTVNNQRSDVIIVSDLNGDGKMDVLAQDSYVEIDRALSWYENNGAVSNKINGLIRLDANGDGCDSDDLLVENIMAITDDGTSTNATFSSVNGLYQFFPPAGDHTTTLMPPNYYEVNPTTHQSNFVGIGNTDLANFCLEPNQVADDLVISLFPTSEARPGFNATYRIVFQNVGTTQLNGSVSLGFNSEQLDFLNTSQTVYTLTSDSITFNYVGLNPYESRSIDLTFNVINDIVSIDDNLSFTTLANPIASDFTPEDNTFNLSQTVIGSFDPNDISVLEGEQIDLTEIDKYLHYIIRFQNTGTASAINVNVNNILDQKLNWESLQLESTSHSARVDIADGNNVTFVFDNINLPDSLSNEEASQGFIAYKIKPKNNVQVGDIIFNEANIFFDFNEPVLTNQVSTEIIELDTEAPMAICQDIFLGLDNDGNATLEASDINNGSTDNIGIVSLLVQPNTFSCDQVGNIDVTLKAFDAQGNVDSCIAIITLTDNILPIAISQDLTIDLAGASSIDISADQIENGSSDNCGIQQLSIDISTFTTIGVYPIVLTVEDVNNNFSTATATVTVVNSTVGILEEDFAKYLFVYPNPANDIVTVKANPEKIKSVVFYNAVGKKVKSANAEVIDVSDLASGIYLLEVTSVNEKKAYKKLLRN